MARLVPAIGDEFQLTVRPSASALVASTGPPRPTGGPWPGAEGGRSMDRALCSLSLDLEGEKRESQ